jgi:hypothetical protein
MFLRNFMIKLPDVTLIGFSGIGYRTDKMVNAFNYSCKNIEFGAVKYIQLDEIKDIDSWSKAMIYEMPKYVETDFCLLIHENGFVVNPESWRDEWLKYDYIGAPWPLPQDSFSYRDEEGEIVRVGNSVSLRSKKLMDLMAQKEWKPYFGNYNEDGFICCHNRKWLEKQGCKFAPLEVAKHFGRELEIPENQDADKPFTFHYNKVKPGRNIEFGSLFL